MCWNQYVSLSTFAFSSFILTLLILNNKYSRYKIQSFQIYFAYFMFSIILMQLVEFFLWRNLNNPFYNKIFSTLGVLLLMFQPFMSLLTLEDPSLRKSLIAVYSISTAIYFIYTLLTHNIHTTVSKKNNLLWNWNNRNNSVFVLVFYTFFLCFPVFIRKYYLFFFMILITLLVSLYYYSKDSTTGSMWCWIANIISLYYALVLLIYVPFIMK